MDRSGRGPWYAACQPHRRFLNTETRLTEEVVADGPESDVEVSDAIEELLRDIGAWLLTLRYRV